MPQPAPHDEFLELCAASTTGRLSAEEQRRLDEHLLVCSPCRESLDQYKAVIAYAIPELAAAEVPDAQPHDSSWSLSAAEAAFFTRLSEDKKRQGELQALRLDRAAPKQLITPPRSSAWAKMLPVYAGITLLFLGLGLAAYQLRARRSISTTNRMTSAAARTREESLQQELIAVTQERDVARDQIARTQASIVNLKKQLAQQTSEFSRAKSVQAQLENKLRLDDSERQAIGERSRALETNLAVAQIRMQKLQQDLTTNQEQAVRSSMREQAFEARVRELTDVIQQKQSEIDETKELLAHDRDIRELMGARDLYIAEVYDVGRSGATQKPYGRVFYTKGKSLIFYAYDLDQQAGVKNASTFEVWGRRGPDKQQALPLGIFYQDNAAKRRWVLKLDDPKRLAQIDAVFVTIEPNGGSRKPSGNPLLFAYLRVDPNHP